MKNARKAVRGFKRCYGVRGVPTVSELKLLIRRLGFTVYGYTEGEAKLRETKTLGLTADRYAFTYLCGKQRYVFYDDLMNETDTQRALAHETAHIYYNHLYRKATPFDSAVNKEWEANLFAAYLLKRLDLKLCIIRGFAVLLSAALLLICGAVLFNSAGLPRGAGFGRDIVYVTPSGSHYHSESCLYGKGCENSFELDRATAREHYLPCELCKPEE